MELTPIQYVKQTDNSKFNDNFNKYTYLSDTYAFVGYNLKNEFFKDKRVRYALSYATPKEEIKTETGSGGCKVNQMHPISGQPP